MGYQGMQYVLPKSVEGEQLEQHNMGGRMLPVCIQIAVFC